MAWDGFIAPFITGFESTSPSNSSTFAYNSFHPHSTGVMVNVKFVDNKINYNQKKITAWVICLVE
ncbi:MAG: hypothetical protein LUQ57_07350 [Methylococcaceae bacterium]|nr:hypothetical protein [Methylococcaceae bacterium]